MMYLHKEDRELLRDIIITVSERSGIEESIVEKDYYVTMILKKLTFRNPDVVFKGGTSLSKAYQVIERFSEDIDITFGEHIGEARRKKIKYNLMKPISETLELPIENWDKIESDKDYNHYDFLYDTMTIAEKDVLRPYVKLETALMTYSYPTEECEIKSIIYEYLKDTDPDIIGEFKLEPFIMKTQSLTRTFIDKLFAICDYYMNEKATRNSRHLYDIYKLKPWVVIDEQFCILVTEFRKQRADMDIKIAPSARENVDVLKIAEKIIQTEFYSRDYEHSTMKLINDTVSYKDVINCYWDIMQKVF